MLHIYAKYLAIGLCFVLLAITAMLAAWRSVGEPGSSTGQPSGGSRMAHAAWEQEDPRIPHRHQRGGNPAPSTGSPAIRNAS